MSSAGLQPDFDINYTDIQLYQMLHFYLYVIYLLILKNYLSVLNCQCVIDHFVSDV